MEIHGGCPNGQMRFTEVSRQGKNINRAITTDELDCP